MAERALATKTVEAKRENSTFNIRKNEHSPSISSPIDRVLFLQRTIGNQAVQRLIRYSALQAKLIIGSPYDIYEQEADRVAEQVIRMPEPEIQKKCDCEEELQKEKIVQAKTITELMPELSPEQEARIDSLRSGGEPLPENARAFFEPRFGYDFSKVRVHTDAGAADSARAINSRAYTIGHNIVFGRGEYAPNSAEGKRLMAHELTHVIQQVGFQQADRSVQLVESGQPIIMRDLFQLPSAECSVPERHSTEIPSSTCCTLPMLREIWNLRAQAIPIVWNAFRKLMNPNDVRSELWDHFRIRPDDRFRVARVSNMFSSMLDAMVSEDVLFMCRDRGDPTCRGRRAASDNCSSTSPRRMWFCGDIAFFPPFFFGSNWLRTMIHEYAHTGCPAAGQILAAGNEFYIGSSGYPPEKPDIAIKNADSYANFALSVR